MNLLFGWLNKYRAMVMLPALVEWWYELCGHSCADCGQDCPEDMHVMSGCCPDWRAKL